jgi:hypothetical protein
MSAAEYTKWREVTLPLVSNDFPVTSAVLKRDLQNTCNFCRSNLRRLLKKETKTLQQSEYCHSAVSDNGKAYTNTNYGHF